MRLHHVTVILAVAASLLWGCADDKTPTEPQANPPEFLATVNVDPCGLPPDQPFDELCGDSSDMDASFDFVLPGIKEEFASGDHVTKVVTFRTGPGTWDFTKHACIEAQCSLGRGFDDLFEGRPLMIMAIRTISPAGSAVSLTMHLIAGSAASPYDLFFPGGSAEMSVDADGFPVIGDELAVSGDFFVDTPGGTMVHGSADVRIEKWPELPVHHKPEPPVVDRPVLSVQQLRRAPYALELGTHTLAFEAADAVVPADASGIAVSFTILEQGLWDFDDARLDFLWVVHESGEIWEPEIPSAWDTFRIQRSASGGPTWDALTEVDIVAGFVDLNGDVRLMRAPDTIELSF